MPESERGPVGSGANEARAAIEELLEARVAELEGAELDRRLAEDRLDVTLPGTPPVRTGHLHLLTQTRREIEDIFIGLGYRVMDGPEVEHDFYNFTALNHPPGHPARMVQDTFYVDPESLADGVLNEHGLPPGPRDVLLRTHTSPNQVRAMEAHEPPLFIIVPGTVYRRDTMDATHLPVFSQVEGLAVGEDITLADLAGTLEEVAKALFGPERETRLKPDFFPFTEPSVQVDVSCFRCGGSGVIERRARPGVQGHRLDRDPRRRDGRPERVRVRRRARLRPGAGPGLRVRDGDRADRLPQARRARPADLLRERRALPGAVRMKVPLSWLREYCDPGLGAEELADLLSMRAVEVERVLTVGPPSPEGFVVGHVVSAEQHPDADRLSVCTVDAGDGERTIVCGAPNVAAGQTVAVALPGAVMPGGQELGKAKLRGVESAGMILAEDELELGDDHEGIMVLDGARRAHPGRR